VVHDPLAEGGHGLLGLLLVGQTHSERHQRSAVGRIDFRGTLESLNRFHVVIVLGMATAEHAPCLSIVLVELHRLLVCAGGGCDATRGEKSLPRGERAVVFHAIDLAQRRSFTPWYGGASAGVERCELRLTSRRLGLLCFSRILLPLLLISFLFLLGCELLHRLRHLVRLFHGCFLHRLQLVNCRRLEAHAQSGQRLVLKG